MLMDTVLLFIYFNFSVRNGVGVYENRWKENCQEVGRSTCAIIPALFLEFKGGEGCSDESGLWFRLRFASFLHVIDLTQTI